MKGIANAVYLFSESIERRLIELTVSLTKDWLN